MAKTPSRQEIDRIIIGNQILIMRSLAKLAPVPYASELEFHVWDVKDWWRRRYGEEVGFSAGLGDKPPERT